MAVPEQDGQIFTTNQSNGSLSATPPHTEDFPSNGILPGAIAAAVFISFLLALYASLWRCMVSAPKRKKRRVRIREQRTTV